MSIYYLDNMNRNYLHLKFKTSLFIVRFITVLETILFDYLIIRFQGFTMN